MKNIGYFILIIIFVSGCADEKEHDTVFLSKRKYDEYGEYYILKTRSKQKFILRCDTIGNLEVIGNQVGNYLQNISFYENGAIMSKIKLDYLNLRKFDRAYYFYEESGNLDTDYEFKDGVKTGTALSYYDSTCIVKQRLLFCNRGKVHQTEKFDKNGNLISVEGCDDLEHK